MLPKGNMCTVLLILLLLLHLLLLELLLLLMQILIGQTAIRGKFQEVYKHTGYQKDILAM